MLQFPSYFAHELPVLADNVCFYSPDGATAFPIPITWRPLSNDAKRRFLFSSWPQKRHAMLQYEIV